MSAAVSFYGSRYEQRKPAEITPINDRIEPEIRQWMGKATIQQLYEAKTPSYQAPLQPRRVKDMARSFDPAKFGVAHIRIDDCGAWWLEDGNHRVNAGWLAEMAGLTVDVKFTEGITEQQAAQIYLGVNDRKMKPRGSLIKAQSVAGDPIPALMFQLAERHGFTVELLHDSDKSHNHIRCSDTLVKMLEQLGEVHLETILVVARNAWDGHPDSLKRDILRGISQFILVYPEIAALDLAKRLSGFLPQQILVDMQASKSATTGGLHRKGYDFGRGVLAAYNRGRQMKNRLEDRFDEFDSSKRVSSYKNRGLKSGI